LRINHSKDFLIISQVRPAIVKRHGTVNGRSRLRRWSNQPQRGRDGKKYKARVRRSVIGDSPLTTPPRRLPPTGGYAR